MTIHTDDLERLRAKSIEHRRRLAAEMGAPDDRGGAQDLREMFLKIQTTIEAIDRALAEERACQT
jgi:hypothetical protein